MRIKIPMRKIKNFIDENQNFLMKIKNFNKKNTNFIEENQKFHR